MAGESRQRLLNRLLVADISKYIIKHCQFRTVFRRNLQTGLRHQRKQTGSLERYCLAAGVRSRDNQAGKILSQTDIQRNDLLRINQRMPAAHNSNPSLIIDLRFNSKHLFGQSSLGKGKIKLRKNCQVIRHCSSFRRNLRRKHAENTFDFRPFAGNQLLQLVADLHNRHWFHKYRRARCRLIMNDARYHGTVFLFDRQHIPLTAHGDNRILQILGICGAMDHAVQLFSHALIARTHLASDGEKLWTGTVGNLFLADNRIGNCLLNAFEHRKT